MHVGTYSGINTQVFIASNLVRFCRACPIRGRILTLRPQQQLIVILPPFDVTPSHDCSRQVIFGEQSKHLPVSQPQTRESFSTKTDNTLKSSTRKVFSRIVPTYREAMAFSDLAIHAQPQERNQGDAHMSEDPTIADPSSHEQPIQWKAGSQEMVF